MVNRRTEKVASLVRAELSRVLIEDILDDSMIGVSINDVQMSGDLKQARVFLGGHFEGKHQREIENRIMSAVPEFKRNLSEVGLRFIPTLKFEWDPHTKEVERIHELLNQLQPEKASE